MRHLFFATATTAVLLATGAFPDRAGAADVGPSPYSPPSAYVPPPAYGPPPGYGRLPLMACHPAITRQTTMARRPAARHLITVRRYGRRAQFRMPFRRETSRCARRVIASGNAVPEAVGGGRCAIRRSLRADHYARPYRGFADRGYGPPPGPGYYGPN